MDELWLSVAIRQTDDKYDDGLFVACCGQQLCDECEKTGRPINICITFAMHLMFR